MLHPVWSPTRLTQNSSLELSQCVSVLPLLHIHYLIPLLKTNDIGKKRRIQSTKKVRQFQQGPLQRPHRARHV
jgi:hypothetical protein